ncbi:hypothetical protein VTO42DRAFT_5428 [Malbranchea cinnamomea]
MPSGDNTGIANRVFHRRRENTVERQHTHEGISPSSNNNNNSNGNGNYDTNVTVTEVLHDVDLHSNQASRYISSWEDGHSEKCDRGVRQAHAVAAVWSQNALIFAYIGIFLVFFVSSLQQQIATNLTPYVTSAFSKHSLLSTTQIVSSIIGAVAKLPIAKIVNIWGRAEGYISMVAICSIGLIMMARCRSVEMYAAAQVFYWIGTNGMSYVLQVFMADTSHIKNRGWLFAFSTSPFVVTAFAGPAAAQKFYQVTGWRWAFGAFAVIIPVISAPIICIFLHNRKKAKELGYLPKERSGQSVWQLVVHCFHNFDVIGMTLVIAAFSLTLLAISLGSYHVLPWKSAALISMFVLGGLSMIAFVMWEAYFASCCLAPFHLLTDKMVLGACLSTATMFVSFYCWDMFFVSYLQVVYDRTIQQAGLIRATGRFKYVAMGFLPVQMIGVGLMVHFRQPRTPIGYVILCQVIISLSGGTLMICEEIAIMAAASHNDLAVVLALQGLFGNLGGAIGQTLSGAIWSQTVPHYLVKYLPAEARAKAMEVYASLPAQLAFPMGSPEREGIMAAYSVGMRRMLIAGVAFLPLGLVWVGM